MTAWHNLSMSVVGSTVNVSVDGAPVFHSTAAGTGAVHPAGMASIRSGFHYARFDDFSVFEVAEPSPWPYVLFDKHLLSPPAHYPGGSSQSPARRSDGCGLASCRVGCAFTLDRAATVVALGRFSSAWNATRAHTLELMDAGTHQLVASVTVDLAVAAADTNGYAWAKLSRPVALTAGARLYLYKLCFYLLFQRDRPFGRAWRYRGIWEDASLETLLVGGYRALIVFYEVSRIRPVTPLRPIFVQHDLYLLVVH